ncbi:stabilizer of axonemal microtubules 5 [Elgaria multicarinata webbii]|uniref:stabilizer of axonemal microtubules 5 n=1 Tax=Elgaria multicarinata webbii TaxID=159646 RepID=UPI002FCCB8B4
MWARTQPQIPAPLSSASFLQASHFQLGFDRRRPEGCTVASPYRTDYPPRWGSYQREPILPPKCAGVLNQDMGGPWEPCSETEASFPPRPLLPRPDICLLTSSLRMHEEPRQCTFTSVTRESYPYPPGAPRPPLNRVDKRDDSVPGGGKEKLPLPASLYQQSYPAHRGMPPVVKARNQHLGDDSALRGDGRGRYDTSYQTQYMGLWAPPAQACDKKVVSIVFGDPRYHRDVSEQRHAYVPRHPQGPRYDPAMAAVKLQQSNVRPGDGQRNFSTIMSESYTWKDPGPTYISDYKTNESSILQGAPDSKEEMTTHRFYFRELTDQGHQPARDPRKGQATVRLGDPRCASFSTTQQSAYQPPPESHRVPPQNNKLMGSNIRFDYHAPNAPTTTTQEMLVPHQQRKQRLTEEDLQKIKYSHLTLPWREWRWFSTEQKDAYTDKYEGPITLAVGDFQSSSVPLGTMLNYRQRKKTAP